MKITVKLFAIFRSFVTENHEGMISAYLDDQKQVKDVIDVINLPYDTPKTIFVHGQIKGIEEILNKGDVVNIFPHIAGG